MFAALGRFVTRRAWYVIGAWAVVTVLLLLLAPGGKSTTDQSDFLPKHYESVKAIHLLSDDFPHQRSVGATIVFERTDGAKLTTTGTDSDLARIKTISGKLTPGSAFDGIEEPVVSRTNQVAIVNIDLADGVDGQKQSDLDQVKTLRTQVGDLTKGTGLDEGITGTLAQNYDQSQSGSNAESIIAFATVGLILVLLGLIFRSVLIALLPLALVGFFLIPTSNKLIGIASHLFNLTADDSTTVILIVVLFGVGTDYFLFFIYRYRELMRQGLEHKVAVAEAVERAGEAITSAGGAVFVAFMTLALSSLGLFRSIGPALAIAVATAVIGSVTLVPAVTTVLGKALFWPSKKWRVEPRGARFEAIGASVGKHPTRYALVSGAFLAILAIFAVGFGGFNPNFDLQSSSSSTNVESVKAQDTLEKGGFSAGATDPTPIVLHASDGKAIDPTAFKKFLTDIAKPEYGVSQVVAQKSLISPSDPGTAIVSVLLKDDPGSDAAIQAVKDDLRPAAHRLAKSDLAPSTEAYVGGNASIFVDFQSAMNRDYKVVFPVAAIIIMLILALLLRSLVAPLYLMAAVGLGFGATLGASVILFQHIKGDAGIIFILPIYIYLFVVALGTDYNILMVARLREEARQGLPSRTAAANAVRHAGPTIAAAGLILAGSFASLMLGGASILVTMGFAISFGIIVSAFVMAMFFVPSLTALIGHAAWWPGHGDETDDEHFARTGEHYTH
jgi:RND superfamily putative drug exporter